MKVRVFLVFAAMGLAACSTTQQSTAPPANSEYSYLQKKWVGTWTSDTQGCGKMEVNILDASNSRKVKIVLDVESRNNPTVGSRVTGEIENGVLSFSRFMGGFTTLYTIKVNPNMLQGTGQGHSRSDVILVPFGTPNPPSCQ